MITLASASRFEKSDIFISFLSESLSADLIVRFVQEWKVQIRARQWWWDEELWGADQMRSAMKDSIWTRLAEERENEENIWEKDNFGVLEGKRQGRKRNWQLKTQFVQWRCCCSCGENMWNLKSQKSFLNVSNFEGEPILLNWKVCWKYIWSLMRNAEVETKVWSPAADHLSALKENMWPRLWFVVSWGGGGCW